MFTFIKVHILVRIPICMPCAGISHIMCVDDHAEKRANESCAIGLMVIRGRRVCDSGPEVAHIQPLLHESMNEHYPLLFTNESAPPTGTPQPRHSASFQNVNQSTFGYLEHVYVSFNNKNKLYSIHGDEPNL